MSNNILSSITTCGVSSTPIIRYEHVNLILLKANKNINNVFGVGFSQPAALFSPILLPIRGYFDRDSNFVCIDLAHEEHMNNYLIQILKSLNLSYSSKLENNINNILSGNVENIYSMFVHSDLYDSMVAKVKEYDELDDMKNISTYATYIADIKEQFFSIGMLTDEGRNEDLLKYVSQKVPPLIRHSIDRDFISKYSDDLLNFLLFQDCIQLSRKLFAPQNINMNVIEDYELSILYGEFAKFKKHTREL